MAEYRLSSQAKADLDEIADYTIEKFGIELARRYRDGLETCFQTLTDTPMVGQSAAAFAPALRDSIPCRVLQTGRPLCSQLFTDGMRFISLLAQSRTALAAENLFLRKQLAFYQERKVRPRTFIEWHRVGFRQFWRWKSRPGRPRIPVHTRNAKFAAVIKYSPTAQLRWFHGVG